MKLIKHIEDKSLSIDELINMIKNCDLCSGMYIDKPCLTHNIYHKFMPSRLAALVVSESPPPGNKKDYLYNIFNRDNLRDVLAKILGLNNSEVVYYLVSKRIFWTTAVKCRPRDKNSIEAMRKNCVNILRFEINTLNPSLIVAFGKTAQKSIREIRPRAEVFETNHPLYYKYCQKLSELKYFFEKLIKTIEEH